MLSFGPFRLNPLQQRLERDGQPLPLSAKAYALLQLLAQNPQRVVAKQELLDTLWPDSFVGEGVLKVYISEIRKALGDDSGAPRYVQTLHRRGYRFLAGDSVQPAGPGSWAGRADELARLRRRWQAAEGGVQALVLISGPAGIGKTTLLQSFVAEARQRLDLRLLQGQCVQYSGECQACLPIIAALTSLAASDPELLPLLRQMALSWLLQMPALLASDERRQLLGQLASHGQAWMTHELLQLLAALCAQRPLMLVLEDLHWSDPSTVDLLAAVARHPGLGRLLVLATLRPAEAAHSPHPIHALVAEQAARRSTELLALKPLSAADIAAYLADRLPGLPADDAAALLRRQTGGNPMFMERVVDSWTDEGWVHCQHGQWRFTTDGAAMAAAVPGSLQLMLQAQFEALSAQQQRLLGACSVAGDSFNAELVAAISDVPAEQVHGICSAMALNHHYLQHSAQRPGHFEFAHDLYREHLLAQLPRSTQRQWHRAAAGFKRQGLNGDYTAADVAHHWEAADEPAEAVPAWVGAAREASRRYAHRDALLLLDRAAALLPAVPQAQRAALDAQLTRKRAAILLLSGNSPACAAQWDHAAALADQQGLTAERIDALLEAAAAYAFIDQERCLQRADLALHLSRRLPGSLLLARAEGYRSYWQLYLQEWQAERWLRFQQCRDQVYQHGSLQHRCLFGILDASLAGVQGRYAQALSLARQARLWAIEGEEHYEAFGSELYAIWLLNCMGETGEALRLCRRTGALAEKNGLDICVTLCRLSEADAACVLGDPQLALQVCAPTWQYREAMATNASVGIMLSVAKTLALAHALQGQHDEAMAVLAQADDTVAAKQLQAGPLWEMLYLVGCAECRALAGRRGELEQAARRLLDLASQVPEMSYVALAHRMLALAAWQQGHEAQARAHSARARAALEGRPRSFADWRVRVTAALVEGGQALQQQAAAELDALAATLFEEPQLLRSLESLAEVQAFRRLQQSAGAPWIVGEVRASASG